MLPTTVVPVKSVPKLNEDLLRTRSTGWQPSAVIASPLLRWLWQERVLGHRSNYVLRPLIGVLPTSHILILVITTPPTITGVTQLPWAFTDAAARANQNPDGTTSTIHQRGWTVTDLGLSPIKLQLLFKEFWLLTITRNRKGDRQPAGRETRRSPLLIDWGKVCWCL